MQEACPTRHALNPSVGSWAARVDPVERAVVTAIGMRDSEPLHIGREESAIVDLRRGRQAVYRPSATAALTWRQALRVSALSAS
mgnify:CR=1 FL=1